MPSDEQGAEKYLEEMELAAFATVSPSSQPHVAPVFYIYADENIYIHTDRDSAKVRNLLQNDKVCVAVYEGEEAVIVWGRAHLVGDETFQRRTEDLIEKYDLHMDEDGKDEYGIPLYNQDVRCVIEVKPERTSYW